MSVTTIRLPEATLAAVKALKKPNESLNTLIAKQLEEWVLARKKADPKHKPQTLPQLRDAVIAAIAKQLKNQSQWIQEAALNLEVYRAGFSAFGRRLEHYKDKQFVCEA